ncbi:hypothetical protein MTO96_004567 [Rhipicephalus appendiculatus]
MSSSHRSMRLLASVVIVFMLITLNTEHHAGALAFQAGPEMRQDLVSERDSIGQNRKELTSGKRPYILK